MSAATSCPWKCACWRSRDRELARASSTLPRELQVRIATRTGYHEHQQVWQGKIDTIDQQIAELTIALRGRVLGLRTVTFQRFAAAMVIGIVALRHLFDPRSDGRPPPVLRSYLAETAFVSEEPTAR